MMVARVVGGPAGGSVGIGVGTVWWLMHLFVLVMVLGLLVVREAGALTAPRLAGGWMPLAAVGPYLLPLAAGWWHCRRARRKLERRPERAPRTLARLTVALLLWRTAVLGLYAAGLFYLGWLTWLREALGELLLIHDLIVLLPPMGVLVAFWWFFYPVERRLRESALVGQLDRGEPIDYIPTRGQYVTGQVRHQLLLVLLPMLALLAWVEGIDRAIGPGSALAAYEQVLVAAGGAGVFVFAPFMVRFIWETEPMPAGPLRDRLLGLCRKHRVRVRELLLWRTHSGMINGAVMGVFGWVRYILLTDGLIERLSDRQVEAVMAHELGHVRRHHMPWMLVCALGTLAASFTVVDVATLLLSGYSGYRGLAGLMGDLGLGGGSTWEGVGLALELAATVGLWAWLFGYISRRFERQADTFAVQHLAERMPDPALGPGTIGPAAAEAMVSALEEICRLNHMPIQRHNWRHGSVQWRIDYLRELVGRPIDNVPVDRQVRRIRWACTALLLAAGYLQANLMT